MAKTYGGIKCKEGRYQLTQRRFLVLTLKKSKWYVWEEWLMGEKEGNKTFKIGETDFFYNPYQLYAFIKKKYGQYMYRGDIQQ